MEKKWILLDLEKKASEIKQIEKIVREFMIGQDRAVKSVLQSFNRLLSGVKEDEMRKRPLGTFLFLGPTGVGKTLLAKVIAKIVTGDPDGLTRVDCSEFSEAHEIAKLIGSPPGYVGYNDGNHGGPPILHQGRIELPYAKKILEKEFKKIPLPPKHPEKGAPKEQWLQYQAKVEDYQQQILEIYHNSGPFYSVVLFDEIEKASKKLFDLLLQIVDNGRLQMGNGEITSFEHSIVILTGNIGSREINKILSGKQLGFTAEKKFSNGEAVQEIYEIVKEEAKKLFPPELIGRLRRENGIVIFQPLSNQEIEKIFELEMNKFQTRLSTDFPIQITLTDEIKNHLLKRADTFEFGAREISRVIDNYIFSKLATLINSGEIWIGDIVKIRFDKKNKELVFEREERTENQKSLVSSKKRKKIFLGLES